MVTGRVPRGHPESALDWVPWRGQGTTLVVLMDVHTLPVVVATLLRKGSW